VRATILVKRRRQPGAPVGSVDSREELEIMSTSTRCGVVLLAAAAACVAAPADLSAQARSSDDWCADAYSGRQAWHCEVKEQTMAPAPALLDVDGGANGSIAIDAWDRADVLVRARVVATADTDAEAQQTVSDVRITTEGGRVRAEGPSRTGERRWWVSWRMSVPRSQALRLDASNGSIAITGVRADIDAETRNGSLRLRDLGGRVRGSTRNGSVTVDLTGSRWEGDRLDVETTNGSVRVRIPEGYAAHLETGTRNGSVRVDFPITVQGRLNREVSADIGGGGPTVRVRTHNGSVRIERKD